MNKTVHKADLHNHTTVSDGYNSPEDLVELAAEHTDIRVLAITDHDNIEGGQRAYEHWQANRDRLAQIEVIKGVEVSSLDGHIVALFIEEHIEPGMPALATINAIHAQGGLAIAAHPYTPMRLIFPEQGLADKIKEQVGFDAVEVKNAAPTELFANGNASRINQQHQRLPAVGGSDSHHWRMVGKTYTYFPGTTADDLRTAIKTGDVQAGGHIVSPFEILPAIWKLALAHVTDYGELKGAARNFDKRPIFNPNGDPAK